jgi:hypothetical protein
MKKSLLVVFFLVFSLSCNKDEEDSEIGIHDVTGLNLYDVTAVPQGVFGKPNSFYVGYLTELKEVVDDEVPGDSDGSFSLITSGVSVYPNPVRNVLNTSSPDKTDNS